jgi:hypothetical protein
MAGYKLYGKRMLYFGAFKEHYSPFAASSRRSKMRSAAMSCERGRSISHQPVLVKLISRIAKLRGVGIVATSKISLPGREKKGAVCDSCLPF